MTTTEDFAHRFITATARGDLEAVATMYAPDAVIAINVMPRELGAEAGLAVLAELHRRATSVRYEVLEVIPTEHGYVQRHVLHVVVPASGDQAERALAVPACLVVRLEGERITRLDEYLDSAQVAPLFGG
ncbi:MAG: nuclear transport factor 2 family protein [Actinomycetes bacterium]